MWATYLMATIRPKHSVSEAGPLQTVYCTHGHCERRREDPRDRYRFPESSRGSSAQDSPRHLDVGRFRCAETGRNKTPGYAANPNSWAYGPGQTGSINYYGLYQTARGARPVLHAGGQQI